MKHLGSGGAGSVYSIEGSTLVKGVRKQLAVKEVGRRAV